MMKALLIGFVVLLATLNIVNSQESPKCPFDDDPTNPTHLAYPKDCSKFYKCNHGTPVLLSCPNGLHWNDKAKICDWPINANCTPISRSYSYMQINSDEAPIKHKDCPPNDDPLHPIHLPYPNDCTKFYKCSYGLAYPMNCPAGEHFGVEIDRCDWPNVAKCDPNAETTPENTTPEVSTPETSTPSTENTPPETSPPPTESTPATTTSEPLPPGIDCSNVPHGTLYPHPDDCRKFVHCDNGRGSVKLCPSNLHFNPVLLVCDWPDKAGCKVGA